MSSRSELLLALRIQQDARRAVRADMAKSRHQAQIGVRGGCSLERSGNGFKISLEELLLRIGHDSCYYFSGDDNS